MRILDLQDIAALLHMIDPVEQNIHLLERDLLRLRNEKPHKRREQEIDPGKHIERVEPAVIQERREKLLHDRVGDVLGLRRHADGLRAHVHAEHLGRPDPDGRAPAGLVEEDEEEEERDDADAGRVALGPARIRRCLSLDRRHDDHAQAHAQAADDQEEFAPEAVDCPRGVEGENDAKGRVEGVDERDFGGLFAPDFLVDFRAVCVEAALAGGLLPGVKDEGEEETFADGPVFPERGIG